MTDSIQRALTIIELHEAELLSWGATGAEWRRDELLKLLAGFGDGESLLAEMLDLALVVETPSKGYRSRSAETLRLLATTRQAFRSESILSGRPLILDYRFLQRPRRRPQRNIPSGEITDAASAWLGLAGQQALRTLVPEKISEFQSKSTNSVLEALNGADPAGVMVTAGTGSGKTLAFYMPMLAWICDQTDADPGVQVLALYPRNELLKDQLRVLVSYAQRLRRVAREQDPVSLATWFGLTPHSAQIVREGKASGWSSNSSGYVCPFLGCPTLDCDGELVWPKRELQQSQELLRCTTCGTEIPGSILRLTRESARLHPARVMLSTTESLNRQLASPGNLKAFGIPGLRAVLLDEVHTYQGTTGAQNAYLLRRLQKALGYEPLWAGLSATLAEPQDFFGQLVNLEPGRVTVVEPDSSQMEESGAEYLVALRHNPHGSTGPLSATIQTAMAISRSLDVLEADPFAPPPESGGIFGSRVFAFTDKLDSTNRLYWDLLDAEGWAWPGRPKRDATPLTLAHLRSRDQGRLRAERREDPALRDPAGQYWWLSEVLGHGIDGDVQKKIGRTSSQDSGVDADADIVVATASLEVGFDDDRVGAVLQHKAPRDAAQFLQRKGRAGRNPATRPWTIVVLSNWGRDRDAWDAYDALFSPVVPPRLLPLENLYVTRIQAVYSLFDWLAAELGYKRGSVWTDAAGPADILSSDASWVDRNLERQKRMASLLTALLRVGPERDSLMRHLRKSLAIPKGSTGDVTLDKILWEAPRPILGAVVPTLRRRLIDQWAGERPMKDDSDIRTRTPLRDFVPGNLFDDLLVPDVEIQVPWARGEVHVEHLPALKAIREFLPGNVSRHFGVWANSKRHWVPLPDRFDSDGARVADVSLYGATPIDDVDTASGRIKLFAPRAMSLQTVVDERISDSSFMRADWDFVATPLGSGTRLPTAGSAATMFENLTAHLHSQGGGVHIVRFAHSARGELRSDGQSRPEKVRFHVTENGSDFAAALGVEIHADALYGRAALPSFDHEIVPSERAEWLRESISRSAEIPEEVSIFDRDSLAAVAELLTASWDWTGGEQTGQQFRTGFRDCAELLDVHDPSNPTSFSEWLLDDDVLDTVFRCLVAARASTRSEEWVASLEQRFTQSAAETLLAALRAETAEDLLIDLDPNVRGGFFISEQSPGGTGQIEALALRLIDEPERLVLSIMDVLRPSEMELLDKQLRSVIESDSPALAAAIGVLADSWTGGHDAVRSATEALDAALDESGVVLGHAAKTALSTRLAGPGAAQDFLDEVREWLRIRDAAQQSGGLAIESRTLAALLANRAAVDAYLHLTEPSERARARAIANVLWPWGQAVASVEFFNPYVDSAIRSVELLRRYWRTPLQVVDLAEWDDELELEAHALLREHGEVLLRAPVARRRALRTALIRLQTNPVEVGPLWCYPEILGLQETDGFIAARLMLRETW